MICRAITVLTSIFFLSPSYADQPQRVLPVKQAKNISETRVPSPTQTTRKVASVSNNPLLSAKVKKGNGSFSPNRPTDLRFGFLAGLSSMSSTSQNTQAGRDEEKLGQNILLGVNADVRFMHYLGMELDGYYGIAPTQTIEAIDITYKKKLQHRGAMFNVKGQLPFYTQSIRWVPKLGVGYGLMGLKQSTEMEPTTEKIEVSSSVKGVYGTVGLDVEPLSWLMLSADYAKSFSASGNYSYTQGALSQELSDSANFSRIRFGVYFRVDPNILLGGQYTKRTMGLSQQVEGDSAGGFANISSSESLNQIAATILFQF